MVNRLKNLAVLTTLVKIMAALQIQGGGAVKLERADRKPRDFYRSYYLKITF